MSRFRSILKLVVLNLVIFAGLFLLLELGVRVHHDGFSGALGGLFDEQVPYSNLGTGNFMVYDEQLGYRLNPDRTNINSRSFRGDEPVIPKSEGTYRIIHLGDSIPWDQPGFVSYSATSLESLGDIEVINASVPGYTAYQEAVFFERFLADLQPDLVIWTYCLNDNYRFLHKYDPEGKMLFTDEARDAFKINSHWDLVVSRSYVLSFFKSALVAREQEAEADKAKEDSEYFWQGNEFNVAWKEHSWALYEEQLKRLKSSTEAAGSQLMIMVAPYGPQIYYAEEGYDPEYVLMPQNRLASLCETHSIPCLDLFPSVRSQQKNGREMYRDGVHFTRSGHRSIAIQLVSFLKSNDLIP